MATNGIHDIPLMADERSELTRALRLPRSVWNTCRMSYMRGIPIKVLTSAGFLSPVALPIARLACPYIVRRVAGGDDAHDIHQMGVTAIIENSTGKVLWQHVTKESIDRPSVESVIKALESVQKSDL